MGGTRPHSFIRRTLEYWLSAAVAVLIVSGFYSGESRTWILRIGSLVPLLLFGVYRIVRRPREGGGRASLLGFSLMMIVSANAAMEIPQGWHNDIFPVNYLFLSLFAVTLGIPESCLLALCPAGIEALSHLYRGTIGSAYPGVLSHASLSLLFVLSVGFLLFRERRQREKVEARHRDVEREARALAPRPTGAAPQADLRLLSKESRHLQATKAVYSLEEKLHGIIEVIKRTVHPYTCALYMVNHEDGLLRIKDMISDSDHVAGDTAIRPGEGMLGWVAKEKRPLTVSEFDKDITGLPYYVRDEGIRSFLAIPIMQDDSVEGVLSVDSRDMQAFTEEHTKLLSIAAAQILDTVDYMKMSQQMRFESQEFAAFNNVSSKLSGTLDLEEVLTLVVESSREIISSDLALLTLYDQEGKTYSIKAVKGEGREEWVGKSFTRESLIGRAVEEHKRVMVFDGLREREKGFPIIGEDVRVQGMDSCLCAPFLAKGEVLGALALFSERRGFFSPYDAKIIGALANQASVSILNARMYRRMEEMATTDGLTGLINHRTFQELLGEEMKRVGRHPAPVSLLLSDIDFFKKINDRYGHPVGDMVLKRVAVILRKSIREIDGASRYGGEEFAVVLTHTDKKGALKMAERIRKAVGEESFTTAGGEDFTVTLSVGVASSPEDARGKQELIDKADAALYLAKRRGRNRVETYSEDMDETAAVKDGEKFTF